MKAPTGSAADAADENEREGFGARVSNTFRALKFRNF